MQQVFLPKRKRVLNKPSMPCIVPKIKSQENPPAKRTRKQEVRVEDILDSQASDGLLDGSRFLSQSQQSQQTSKKTDGDGLSQSSLSLTPPAPLSPLLACDMDNVLSLSLPLDSMRFLSQSQQSQQSSKKTDVLSQLSLPFSPSAPSSPSHTCDMDNVPSLSLSLTQASPPTPALQQRRNISPQKVLTVCKRLKDDIGVALATINGRSALGPEEIELVLVLLHAVYRRADQLAASCLCS